MSTKKILTSLLVTGLSLTAILYNSCKDPLQDVDLVVNTELFKTNISVQVRDYNSTSPVGIADVTLKIIGGSDYSNPAGDVEFPDYVLDAIGNKDFEVANGFTAMVLSPGTVPTEDKPVRFTIVASAPGYLTTYKNVFIPAEGDYNVVIGMTKLDDLPQGVSSSIGTISAPSAGTTAEIIFEAAATNGKAEKAVVTINPGTKFYDEAGTQLTGTLDFTMVHFDNQNEKAILSAPGSGLEGGIYYDSLGNKLDAGINPGSLGLVDIVIKKGTKKVKTFSQPVKLQMELNGNSLYSGEQFIAAGNKVPVWSTNENTGVTKMETEKEIYTNGNGKLEVSMDLEHLTEYVLTPFYSAEGFCLRGTYSFMANNPFFDFSVKLYESPTNKLLGISTSRTVLNNFVCYSKKYYFKVYVRNQLVLTTPVYNGCTSYVESFNFQEPQPPTYIPFKADVRGKCENKPNKRIAPNLAVKIWDEETNEWLPYGDMKKGYLNGQLVKGKTHRLGAFFYGLWQERNIDANGSEVVFNEVWDLPPMVCSQY
ncbi:MAG: hypothetical protein K1X82_12745 [Bacteroidia bacterium]|nr:hypothetical protein [Bacteroidia bacterium]